MEALVHTINGKDYLLIDVPVTQRNEKVVNETLAQFDTIDQSVNILSKNILLRKVLISTNDVAKFQSEIKLIDDRINTQNRLTDEYNYRVFYRLFRHLGIATLVIFAAIIIYSLVFKA